MLTLRLTRELYAERAVSTAASRYEVIGIAHIDIDSEGPYLICSFSDCPYGERQTMYEFENYVIDFMNTSATGES